MSFSRDPSKGGKYRKDVTLLATVTWALGVPTLGTLTQLPTSQKTKITLDEEVDQPIGEAGKPSRVDITAKGANVDMIFLQRDADTRALLDDRTDKVLVVLGKTFLDDSQEGWVFYCKLGAKSGYEIGGEGVIPFNIYGQAAPADIEVTIEGYTTTLTILKGETHAHGDLTPTP